VPAPALAPSPKLALAPSTDAVTIPHASSTLPDAPDSLDAQILRPKDGPMLR
jgi:hypothetical protein